MSTDEADFIREIGENNQSSECLILLLTKAKPFPVNPTRVIYWNNLPYRKEMACLLSRLHRTWFSDGYVLIVKNRLVKIEKKSTHYENDV